MKKLLLLAALMVAANGFSAITMTGGTSGSYSIVNNALGGKDLSGTWKFTSPTASISYDSSDQILTGTKIQVGANQTITITNNTNGDQLVIQGDGVGETVYEFTTTLTANSTFSTPGVTPPGNQSRCGTGGVACPITVSTTPTTPTTPTPVPTPAPAPAPTGEVTIPRSRVNLDLMKNTKATFYRNIENYKEGGYDLDVEYAGTIGGKYTDKNDKIKYDFTSHGIALTGSKNFGSITLGGAFGYHDSKVKYKETFSGVKENISSYQLGLSGRYNLTDKTDLTAVMTYGYGSHKFETETGLGDYHGMSYKSKIYDFDMRFGTKYGFSNGYIKPYIGLGVTLIDEKEIEKIGAGSAVEDWAYSVMGTYGEVSFGKVDLFGNFEYTQRLDKDSYHGKRDYKDGYIAPLKYSRAEYNLGLGMRYKVTDILDITANYELDNFKNHAVKIGFGMEF